MKILIVGKNVDVTPRLRSQVEKKIGKLEKYFNQETTVHVTLKSDKGREKIEVTIPLKGKVIRSEQSSDDMFASIDMVEEVIERQLKKYKNKIIDKRYSGNDFKREYLDKDYEDEARIKIERVKQFEIKPMYPEDAAVQMELLGHAFFVFINAETDQTCVVYKRKSGTYGLLEPEE